MQYAQRNANVTPHAKSGIKRIYNAFIEKTKAEKDNAKNKILKNTFIKKMIAVIIPPPFHYIQQKIQKLKKRLLISHQISF